MKILSTLLEISVYSAAIILFILLIKKLLGKRMTAAIQFSLWVLLILRLLIPFSLNSGLHLVKLSAPIELPTTNAAAHESLPNDYLNEYNFSYAPAAHSSTTDNNIEFTSQQQLLTGSAQQQETSKQTTPFKPTLSDILIAVWLAGVLAMLVFMALTYIRLRRRIQNSATILVPENIQTLIDECKLRMNVSRPVDVLISSEFESTMLLAALRPKLIIPAAMIEDQNGEVLKHCLLHEFAHCKRRDYLWYLIVNVLCAVYWFNPAVWLGIRLMKQDMEAACDAHVVRTMTDGERNRYAGTLLCMFTNQTKRFQIAMGMGVAAKKEAAKRLRGIYMRRKMKLQTKLTVAILVLLMLFTCFTTACQPGETVPDASQAVEQNSSVQNETDNQEPFGKATEDQVLGIGQDNLPLFESLRVPQHYSTNLTLDKLIITANAEVIFPDNIDIVPIYKVSPVDFTQEQVDRFIEALFDDETLYEWESGVYRLTKAEVERLLSVWKQNKASVEGEFASEEGQAWCDEVIERWEQEYLTAPEENSVILSDEKLKPRDLLNHETGEKVATYYGLIAFTGDESNIDARLFIENNNNLQEELKYEDGGVRPVERNATLRYSISSDNDENYWQTPPILINQESVITDEKVLENLKITPREAQELAENTLENAGIDYMELHCMSLVDNANNGNVDDIVSPAELHAYRLQFVRVVDDIHCAYIEGATTSDYGAFWDYETLNIYIDDRGIFSLEWRSPLEVKDYLSANADLLPFDSIEEKFEDTIQSTYLPESNVIGREETIINIDRVALELFRVAEQDSIENGLLIPVWNFYGTKTVTYNNGDHNSDGLGVPVSLLIVNAIDGSIINPENGQ